jgi:hypothetical protein
VFVLAAALTALVGLPTCGFENSPEDTPVPIPNSNAERGQVIGAPRTNASLKKTAASPSATVSRPTVQCSYTVDSATAQTAGSEKNGAIVGISKDSALDEPILLFRIAGSTTVEGSFLAVEDMVFGNGGTHETGAYFFELRTADGRSCYITFGMSENDAAAKKNFILTPVFP